MTGSVRGSAECAETCRTAADLLTTARRPGAAEPTEIHVRAELHDRMLREAAHAGSPVRLDEQRRISHLDDIRLVIDEDLPSFPGYEIHRRPETTDASAAA